MWTGLSTRSSTDGAAAAPVAEVATEEALRRESAPAAPDAGAVVAASVESGATSSGEDMSVPSLLVAARLPADCRRGAGGVRQVLWSWWGAGGVRAVHHEGV